MSDKLFIGAIVVVIMLLAIKLPGMRAPLIAILLLPPYPI